jgi:hypothetical protein
LCLIWDQSDETEIIRYTLIKIKKRKCEWVFGTILM